MSQIRKNDEITPVTKLSGAEEDSGRDRLGTAETSESRDLRQAEERAGLRPQREAERTETYADGMRRLRASEAAATGGKTAYTERVRTDELAVGDVIEHSNGSRQTVTRVGERRIIGARTYLWVEVTDTDEGAGASFWGLASRWDRLTEEAKREAGYPAAEHDEPTCAYLSYACEHEHREPSARALRISTIAELVQEMADGGEDYQAALDRMATTVDNLGAPALTDQERRAIVILLSE